MTPRPLPMARQRGPSGPRERQRSGVRAAPVCAAPALLLACAVLLALPALVPAPAPRVTDSFITNCTQIPDTPATVFQPWSNAATWTALGFSGIPGVGALAGTNVTIPCGMAVLLDVLSINVTVLQIQGHLKVQDPAVPVSYVVVACMVLVEGQLSIGAPTAQFRSRITFTLMPNPNGRQNFVGSFVLPAEPAFPRTLGHKVFAVMGGQVRLHGMPGGADSPSWIKLNVSMRAGDFQLIVDRDVSQLWPIGARIAVASTDYRSDFSEEFTVEGFDTDPRGTVVYVTTRAQNNHYGDPFGIPDGFGGFIDERAEVALLTRNIVITGLDEQNTPWVYEGGHFIVFMTPVGQFIEGVQYLLMGQQGNLGRYNIHFHVCQDTGGRSLVRKNAIVHSKQRCIVVHGTHNLTLDSNIAYNTSGHCFMLEEGGEQNNTFINNLGMRTRRVDKKIADDETDDSPSTFWITNMLNHYIRNVAAGSESSGFWTELRGNVRGMSLSIPALSGIKPDATPLGLIINNTAHSNGNNGWQFYPKGVRPRAIWDVNQTTLSTWQWPSVPGFIYNLLVYKHQGDGVFMHNSENMYLVNVTAADNNLGVNLRGNYNGGVVGGRFLALSNNLGNPKWCNPSWDTNWPNNCGPASGCSIGTDPARWRARNWNHWQNPTFGIHMDSPSSMTDGFSAYNLSDLRFAGYEQQCNRSSAGIGTGLQGNIGWWNPSQAVTGVRTATPNMPTFWFAYQNFTWPTVGTNVPSMTSYSESQTNYAVWDKDGSLGTGTKGGYLIAPNPGLLPPLARYSCTAQPQLNAIACPNTCYRGLRVWWNEDTFGPASTPNRTRGDFSYLIVRRVEDNFTRILDGNSNNTDNWGTQRTFWVSLLAPATYELTVGLPYSRLGFWPANMTLQYWDNGACGAALTLRIMPIPSNQWAITTSDTQFWSSCPGSTWSGRSSPWPVQYQYVCHRMRQVLQLTLLSTPQQVFLFNARERVKPCRLPMRCGVVPSSDWYFYNTSGVDLKPVRTGAMGFAVPRFDQSSWLYGQAIIGNSGWGWNVIKSLSPIMNNTNGLVHYFRKNFTVANSACYSGIYLEFIPILGHLVFLNNVEIFRWNMPAGNITNTTLATAGQPWPSTWFPSAAFINITDVNASFVEGMNFLAFQAHAPWSNYAPYFDARVSLLYSSVACQGASVMPEVCDGLDNNFDGLVDIDPSTGRLLTRPCSTSCGTGIETCLQGAFQNCTAPPSRPETCNNVDDNCDGLVDNGLMGTQLDCAAGSVCFQGQCLVQGPLTTPQPVFNRSTSGWWYLDQGWPWQTYPRWINGTFSNTPGSTAIFAFRPGVAPFGTSNYSGPIGTQLNQRSPGDLYNFFLRNYTLTAAEAASTYALSVVAKRDNGVIVWANGVEIMRNNFNSTWNPATESSVYPLQSGTNWTMYWPNNPLRNTGINTVKAGQNWIAAQVANTQWQNGLNFDLELVRLVNRSCSALPGAPTSCVRNPPNDTIFFTSGSVWKYLDANYAIPPFTWIVPSFDDSAWPSGRSPLGLPQWWISTPMAMNRTTRRTYYFRKAFPVLDGSCFYNVTFNLRALDGAVVYVNGVEAFRFQITPDFVFPDSFAGNFWPSTDRGTFSLPTGWLVSGNNTIAAEIHVSQAGTGNWYFDLTVGGQREAINCNPLPA